MKPDSLNPISLRAASPDPTPPPQWSGWFGDYVRDPGAALAHLQAAVYRLVVEHGLILGPGLLAVVAAAVVSRRRWQRRCHARLCADARFVDVLAPPVVDPAGGEALWANLVGLLRPAWQRRLLGQPHLGFEYLFNHTGVRIRVWVPGLIPPGLVERAVQAAWPGAHTHTRPATTSNTPAISNPATAAANVTAASKASPSRTTPASTNTPASSSAAARREGVVVGGRLRLARGEALPIRTAFDADPLRALLGAPLALERGEWACVQILARPAAGSRLTRTRRTAQHRGRHGPHGVAAGLVVGVLDGLTALLTGRPTSPRTGRGPVDPQTALATSSLNRATVTKQHGAQYATAIRYALLTHLPSTPTGRASRSGVEKTRVAAALARGRGRAHTLASAFAAYTGHNRYQRTRLRHPAHTLAARRLGRGDLLSVPELAALAHLPVDAFVPGLERAGARALAPPPGIPTPGPGVKPLGVTDTQPAGPIGLRVADARHHLHVVGATGSGKSTLLAHLILDDADSGRGVVLIDPKGDLVTDLLARLPRRCADRIVLLDPDSRARPPCLNPLDPPADAHDGVHEPDGDSPDNRLGAATAGIGAGAALAVENVVSVFRRLYAAFWGPRTDDVMRAACLTLLHTPGVATLADIPKLLTDPAYRTRATTTITDPVLRGFWAWYEDLSDPAKAQAVAPLLNKLRAFLLRPFARAALASGPADLDLTHVLDHGGILLVRIPKGSLGEDTTRLIGSLLVAAVWQAATARARQPQPQRADASLVIDECHNFLHLPYPIEDMLAEARGFRLSMTLAHQHLGQLSRDLREGIAANARSKIFFTAGPDDAHDLARHTQPRLTDHDLAHLDAFHAAARLVNHGAHTPAFTLHTQPLPAPVPGQARMLRAAAARNTRNHRATAAGTGGPNLTKPAAPDTGSHPRPANRQRPSVTRADPRRRPS